MNFNPLHYQVETLSFILSSKFHMWDSDSDLGVYIFESQNSTFLIKKPLQNPHSEK